MLSVYRGRFGSGWARAGMAGQPAAAGTVTGGGTGAVVAVEVVVDEEVDVVPDCRTSACLDPPLLHAVVTVARATASTPKPLQVLRLEPFVPVRVRHFESWRGFGTGPWWRKYGPAVARLTPTCVWRISPELVLALQERFGDPVDAYVNGSQVWLRDDGPGGVAIEWRLHPVADYQRPDGVDTYDVFTSTSYALGEGVEPPVPVERLWD